MSKIEYVAQADIYKNGELHTKKRRKIALTPGSSWHRWLLDNGLIDTPSDAKHSADDDEPQTKTQEN